MNDITFPRTRLAGADHGSIEEPMATDLAAEHSFVWRYLSLAKRWKWVVIGATSVALILGLVVTLLMTPKYTASATLEIQRQGDRVVNLQGVEPEVGPVDQEFYQTQYGLLKSQTLAQRVATDLRLYDDAAFFEMFGKSKTAAELRDGGRGGNTRGRNERIREAADVLLDNLSIDPERLSRLVSVSFTSPDSALSARVVNAWTRLFIETSLGRRFEATAYARDFLEDRLAQLRERLQDSERALVRYATNQRIINIPSNVQGGAAVERPLVAEDLAVLNQELNAATAARVAAESRLRGNGGSTIEALNNQAISDLRTRRATLSSDRARMLTQFNPDYPPVQALDQQIAELDRALAREESRVGDTLQRNYAAASQRESVLRARVKKLQSDLMDLRGRTIQYNIYEREVDTNRQLYDALLQRYKEVGVAGGVGVNNISIVDSALVPEKPSSPNLIINLLLAGLCGGAIGIGLALLLDQADEAISDPRELAAKLKLPLLGTIPKSHDPDPMAELEDPKSEMVEAYISVQARLAFTTENGLPRTLAVTSTRPGEGKSTTAFALARTLSRTGRKVIVVDADMRSPSQHEMLGLSNERGLSNYLSRTGDLASLIQTGINGGLTLLSAGPRPPNAAELLTSDRLPQLIVELTSQYDHVIMDAPPVMGLADTPLIASKVDGCIFVIEAHITRTTMAQIALDRLQSTNTKVFGGLLTMFDTRRADFGYGYEYGYGYGDKDTSAA
jgi:succinoglycan biosynthesis transport protein ExoP